MELFCSVGRGCGCVCTHRTPPSYGPEKCSSHFFHNWKILSFFPLLSFNTIIYSLLGALYLSHYYSDGFFLYINGNGGFVGSYLNQTFLNSLILINEKLFYYTLVSNIWRVWFQNATSPLTNYRPLSRFGVKFFINFSTRLNHLLQWLCMITNKVVNSIIFRDAGSNQSGNKFDTTANASDIISSMNSTTIGTTAKFYIKNISYIF